MSSIRTTLGCCLMAALALAAGCGQSEEQRLREENERLRQQVESRQQPGAAVQGQQQPAAPADVPSVEGYDVASARAMIERAGLVASIEPPVCDESRADGAVLRQYPSAGTTLAPGSSVSIWPNVLSEGTGQASTATQAEAADLIAVPDLLGCDRSAARSRLEASGLWLGGVNFHYTPYERSGLVKRQEPGPGQRVRQGSRVTIWLSTEFKP